MTMNRQPFASSASVAGHGEICLTVLPPATPVLQNLSYQYPLKLIAPSAISVADSQADDDSTVLVHSVFILTYGGGLVAGDTIALRVRLAPATRLVLLTQGSTKIFKSPSSKTVTRQNVVLDVGSGAALCYLPDPVQPFEASCFEQTQTYEIADSNTNLCICDWVSEGRPARGEHWSFTRYVSRNEVWSATSGQKKRLLLRDSLILDTDATANENIFARMNGLGVFGTLIICGPLFAQLGAHFLTEFNLMPRIGARQWDASENMDESSSAMVDRATRVQQEIADGLLWTATSSRGFVVVKFGSKNVEGARKWLRHMLGSEGTVERTFGERALLCLR